ncbi:Multiple sugar-binding protein [Caprobacter fermentans]|uniref:Multiple sugar-binding protein n=1 Tax=Caproicibacter fermentans TaxID=2576756 RepID=A0A6N8HYU7_9FIRM|nr:extracellular solute-binding protein [Caproicibacter fermentans]MVB10848.1 Multiple sugar-binding protein [Caproicibacter fermentans]
MKSLKRVLAVLMAAAMSAVPLAGCSAGNSAAESTGSAASAATSSASAQAASLELFSTKTENAKILKTLADEFHTQNPSITITISSPQDAGTVLKTRLTKNDIPDILAMGGDATYTEVQSAGVLEDLSQESYVSDIQDSYKQMIYNVQQDKEQKLYGIPYATNASGVLYNEDIFQKSGVQVPTTWDAFMTLCKTLKSSGITPFELTFKDSWTALCPWNSMAPDLQPDNFTSDRLAGKTTFAATHQEVAQKYLQVLSYAQKDYMGTTYADGNTAFAEGKAAMMINGNWAISEFKKVNANFNVNLFAFPASNDSSKNYVTSGVDVLLAVSNDSPSKDAAKKFVSFMVQPENAQKYIQDQFAFSAVKGVEQSDKTVAGVKEDIANGKVANFPDHYYPSGFDLASLAQNFGKNAAAGMDANKNIADFLKQCDQKYDAANVS